MTQDTIIHFSGDDYWISNPHSRYHLTYAFRQKGYKILWINPIGTRFPSLKRKRQFFDRIFRKLKSMLKLLKKIEKNWYVYTPILLPTFTNNKFQLINNFLLKLQMGFLRIILQIDAPVLFFSSPVHAQAINFVTHRKAIYYYSDQYTAYRELSAKNKEYLMSLDKLLYTQADLILCASRMIYDNIKSKSNKPVYYAPHQVDFELFQKALQDKWQPPDIAAIPYPVIGYYGTLTDSNDWELIEYCARQRPQYNFVFIGDKNIKLPQLEVLDNVFFLGRKTYHEIPHYAKSFDVCLMFWIRREWIKHCSPLKLKEYLSAERPVVSTYIEEVVTHYPKIIYISENTDEFLNNLDLAIGDNRERIVKGLEIVKNESWLKLANKISFLLQNEEG